MTKAYVLIEAAVGKVMHVENAMRRNGYAQVNRVTGPYDVIAVINGNGLSQINDEVEKIHRIDGVTRTVTCLAFNLE